MDERTIADQVRICRGDLRSALTRALGELDRFENWSQGSSERRATGVYQRVAFALSNAEWLENLTRPNPELEPVPAVAHAALDRALVGVDPEPERPDDPHPAIDHGDGAKSPTDEELADAAFGEALATVLSEADDPEAPGWDGT